MDKIEMIIPSTLESTSYWYEDFPFVGAIEAFDGAILFVPTMLILVAGFSQGFAIPGFIVAFIYFAIVGAALILKPDYKSLKETLSDKKELYMTPDNYEQMLDTSERQVEGYDISSGEDTRQFTMVKQIYPDLNCIETTDGVVVGAVRIPNKNLDLAESSQLKASINSFHDFLNHTMIDEDNFQLFSTRESVDMLDQVARIENVKSRIDDDNEFLKAYAEHRIDRVENYLTNLKVRNTYIIISVSEDDVMAQEMGTGDRYKRVGNLFGKQGQKIYIRLKWALGGSTTTKSEMKFMQISRLNERLQQIRDHSADIAGQRGEIVSSDEFSAMLKRYWEGLKVDPLMVREGNLVRNSPVVTREQEYYDRLRGINRAAEGETVAEKYERQVSGDNND